MLDGRGVAGDTGYADTWRALVSGLTWDGNQAMYEGAVVYVLAEENEFTGGFNAAIDGFTIQGGDQQGFPNNLTPADPTQTGICCGSRWRHLRQCLCPLTCKSATMCCKATVVLTQVRFVSVRPIFPGFQRQSER